MATQKDNSTFAQKLALRRLMLEQMEQPPVVMETHGGLGQLWAKAYAHLPTGIVFEKDSDRAAFLAKQRRSWAVYEGDCVEALAGGAGGHLAVNVLDLDPYGEPWPALDAFMQSERPRTDVLWVVVNDGLRGGGNVRLGNAWRAGSLQAAVMRFGNDLHGRYLEVCRWMIQEKAALAGYSLDRFAGYYCGIRGNNTHYLARLSKT